MKWTWTASRKNKQMLCNSHTHTDTTYTFYELRQTRYTNSENGKSFLSSCVVAEKMICSHATSAACPFGHSMVTTLDMIYLKIYWPIKIFARQLDIPNSAVPICLMSCELWYLIQINSRMNIVQKVLCPRPPHLRMMQMKLWFSGKKKLPTLTPIHRITTEIWEESKKKRFHSLPAILDKWQTNWTQNHFTFLFIHSCEN